MANRQFQQFQLTLEKYVVTLFGSAVIGGTGAVGTVKGGGIESVTRNDVGNYTIKLQDDYYRFLGIGVGFIAAAGSGIANVEVEATPATFQADFRASREVTVQCRDFAGAAADPASGSVMGFTVVVRNTNIGPWDA